MMMGAFIRLGETVLTEERAINAVRRGIIITGFSGS